MATLFDNSCVAYQLIAIPVSNSRPNPYFIFIGSNEVQLNNIRLWGVLRFYRLRSTPLGTSPTQFTSIDLRAQHHRMAVPDAPLVGATDGVQFVPTYDFNRVVILDNTP